MLTQAASCGRCARSRSGSCAVPVARPNSRRPRRRDGGEGRERPSGAAHCVALRTSLFSTVPVSPCTLAPSDKLPAAFHRQVGLEAVDARLRRGQLLERAVMVGMLSGAMSIRLAKITASGPACRSAYPRGGRRRRAVALLHLLLDELEFVVLSVSAGERAHPISATPISAAPRARVNLNVFISEVLGFIMEPLKGSDDARGQPRASDREPDGVRRRPALRTPAMNLGSWRSRRRRLGEAVPLRFIGWDNPPRGDQRNG